jgi:hypothetical protein
LKISDSRVSDFWFRPTIQGLWNLGLYVLEFRVYGPGSRVLFLEGFKVTGKG